MADTTLTTDEQVAVTVDAIIERVQYDLTGDQMRPMRECDDTQLRAELAALLVEHNEQVGQLADQCELLRRALARVNPLVSTWSFAELLARYGNAQPVLMRLGSAAEVPDA